MRKVHTSVSILEKQDPSFGQLFYPKHLHYPGDWRTVQAIEVHWPAYFPTRKECRGKNWSLTIAADKPLYKPSQKAQQKLAQWKATIHGTIAELRAYRSDKSWKRFLEICQQNSRIRPHLGELKLLAEFLAREESMRPPPGPADYAESVLQKRLAILLSVNSPYLQSDPARLRFLKSQATAEEKLQMINAMQSLLDRPLMTLAVLQLCADKSSVWFGWLDLRGQITAILKNQDRFTFRKTWLDHAMQISGATKSSGEPFPREWARRLLFPKPGEKEDIVAVGQKAIEVNAWRKGKKLPSIPKIEQFWEVVATVHKLKPTQGDTGRGVWMFSWMVTLLMEKHYEEIQVWFKNNPVEIKRYYRRFFHHLKTALAA